MLSRMWNKEVGEGGVNWYKYFGNTDVSNLIWKCGTRQPSISSLGVCPRECICPQCRYNRRHVIKNAQCSIAYNSKKKKKKQTWNIQIDINSGIDKEIAVISYNRILYSTHIKGINLGAIFKIFNNGTA